MFLCGLSESCGEKMSTVNQRECLCAYKSYRWESGFIRGLLTKQEMPPFAPSAIFGCIAILLCFFLIFYLIWWLLSRRQSLMFNALWKRYHERESKQRHFKSIQIEGNTLSSGDIATAGTGAFRQGVITNEISGLLGASVAMKSPLIAAAGLQLPVRNITSIQTQLHQSGIYRFSNTSSVIQQGTLPLANQNRGSVFIIENASGNPNVQLLTQPTDSFNLSVTSVFVPTWALLFSDAHHNWLIQIV
jgi:hypothetical protein